MVIVEKAELSDPARYFLGIFKGDMKRIIFVTIAITALVAAAFPQKTYKTCDIAAFVRDEDPNGLNVRDSPDKYGKVIKRLMKGDAEISVEITRSAGNGWVEMTNAEHGEGGDIFKDKGWVFASMLGTGTRGYPNYDAPSKLFSTPSKTSRSLTEIASEAELVVIDCAGKWAKVRYKQTTGWLAPENQCGSPFTTCN